MVLIEVREHIIEKYRRREYIWDVKLHSADRRGDIRRASVADVLCIAAPRWLVVPWDLTPERHRECGRGDLAEVGALLVACWRGCIALGVIDRELLDLRAGVQQQASDGRENDAHAEKQRQDGLGRENGLPGFQSLLAKSGICPPESVYCLSSPPRSQSRGIRTWRPSALLLLIRLLIVPDAAGIGVLHGWRRGTPVRDRRSGRRGRDVGRCCARCRSFPKRSSATQGLRAGSDFGDAGVADVAVTMRRARLFSLCIKSIPYGKN